MTAIVGIAQDGNVWIGGDSAGVNSHEELQLRRDSKVFKNGEYLIGVSGSWRAMQTLRFARLPYYADGINEDPFTEMVKLFLPAVRKMDLPEFEALVGFRGRLFHLYGCEQVSEEIAEFEACGSGAQVARGALHSLSLTCKKWHPEQMIRIAFEAAERFCSGVRGPFTILSI